MTPELIERFVEQPQRDNMAVNIHFKDRDTVTGIFIKGTDYDELKGKNFWRVISSTHMDDWAKTRNMSLPRIFNGASFTRLTDK